MRAIDLRGWIGWGVPRPTFFGVWRFDNPTFLPPTHRNNPLNRNNRWPAFRLMGRLVGKKLVARAVCIALATIWCPRWEHSLWYLSFLIVLSWYWKCCFVIVDYQYIIKTTNTELIIVQITKWVIKYRWYGAKYGQFRIDVITYADINDNK